MKRKYKTFQLICYGLGALSCVYFVSLCAALGVGYTFNYFWLIMGMTALSLGRWGCLLVKLPSGIRAVTMTVILVAAMVFFVVEGFIIAGAFDEPQPDADYVIVLGAKVNGTTPSKRLQERIDAAVDYAEENPKALIIASGGKGADEGISEALAIRSSLMEQGIAADRIVMEDQSTSTEQNLVYSRKIITSDLAGTDEGTGSGETAQSKEQEQKTEESPGVDARVVVVTSNFHVFRAVNVAKEAGYTDVSGLPAPAKSDHMLSPSYYIREFFGVINEFVLKNL